MIRSEGDLTVGDFVLGVEGGTVVVRVHASSGSPVGGSEVFLLADSAGYEEEEHGSLLPSRAFHQRDSTSRFGNALFSGVPAGRIRVHAISGARETRKEEHIEEGARLEITLTVQ